LGARSEHSSLGGAAWKGRESNAKCKMGDRGWAEVRRREQAERAKERRMRVVDLRQTYQLKVTLRYIKPPIWRRVLVENSVPLSDLHVILQIAMGWTDSHLHQFRVGDRTIGEPDPDFGPDLEDELDVRLRDVLREKGDAFVYEYDFGDGWVHQVELQKVMPFDPDMPLPLCTAGRMACPPENVGGPPGYSEFLKAIGDPQHPDHDDTLEWVGGGFDPQAFDRGEVNVLLDTYRILGVDDEEEGDEFL